MHPRTFAILALVVSIIAVLQPANARRLHMEIEDAPASETASLDALVQQEATVMADALINSLEVTDTVDTAAVEILDTAVDGSKGPVATASVLTRLSEYVNKEGCTESVQQIILEVLDKYNGSTTAFVSALRALDVYTTDVTALGACLQKVVA